MDYEKEYKEALERAREYHKVDTDNTLKLCAKGTMEYLFPVLKESNDEKIRKTLLGYFKDQDAQYTFRGLTNNEVITWLEKVIIPNYNDIDSSFIEDIKEVIADAPLLMQSDKEKMIAWLEKQGESDETKAKTFLINKGYPIDTNSVFPTYEEMYNIIREGLEKQGNIDKASYEIAEKEKCDFVTGQFIECRKSFDEFKEYNSYWFEYVGNDTYIGRSDNILNKKFHITPRQLYRLFTQEHYCYYPKENNEFEKQMDKGSQVKLPIFTFDDVLALQCCMETVKKVQEDKDLYEKLKCLHGRVYDAYYLEKQGKSKFEQCTQDGDKIVTNEDGTHFNVSQLERVVKKVTESKEAVKEFLKKAGIMDKNGELADEYKPEKQGGNSVTITKCNNSITNAEVVSHPTVTVSTTIEPKFKVGDWVVTKDGKVNQVKTVCDELDAYTLDDETYFAGSWKDIYHLWTIKDAEDGDVLQLGKVTAIFKEFIGNNCKCYCSVYKGELEIPADDGFDNVYGCYDTHPATKEQRDLLFQKMHEAGYEWDSEKKELMKIEPKPAMEIKTPEESLGIDSATYNNIVDECIYGEQKPNWSEEDEEMFKLALKYLKQSYYSEESVVSWFNSLKNRVNPQPQKEWSEEDEENLNQLHKLIVKKAYEEYEIDTEDETLWGKYAILDNWLKTLKDRVQLHWKPSEEQMKGIDCAIKTLRHQLNVEDKRLNSLYKQLKKL